MGIPQLRQREKNDLIQIRCNAAYQALAALSKMGIEVTCINTDVEYTRPLIHIACPPTAIRVLPHSTFFNEFKIQMAHTIFKNCTLEWKV